MAKDTEKKMSTSELVGHLRGAERLFKTLQYAREAAEFFHDLEKEQKGMELAIKKLNAEFDKAEALKVAAEKETNRLTAEAMGLENEIATVRRKASDEAAKIRQDAVEGAKKIEDAAKAKVSKIREEEAEAVKAKEAALQATAEAEDQLKAIEKQVLAAKKKFLKSFGE